MTVIELVKEIIYYFKYFEIMETNNEALAERKIVYKLNNVVFIENLIKKLQIAIRLKRTITAIDRKRLEVLLIELEKLKTMLFLDQFLEEKSKVLNW